jgi:BCD family chlorophyll transporter-like MFS transporter
MGLWGAAQSIAFALGGVVGTGLSDLARWWLGSAALAYAGVFMLEAALFVWASRLVQAVDPVGPQDQTTSRRLPVTPRSAHEAAILS